MNEDNFILEDIDRELSQEEQIQKIISEFDPKAVEYNADEGGWSVKIQDQKSGMEFWVDVWIDTNYNDVSTEWNQYIFDITNSNDIIREAVQGDNSVFDLATSEAVNYLEEQNIIKQDDKANWFVVYHTPEDEQFEIYDSNFEDDTGDISGAGRVWNDKLGTEQEFTFSFTPGEPNSPIYFVDFATGNDCEIRNQELINAIYDLVDDYQDEIEHFRLFAIDESKKVTEAKEDKYEFIPGYYEWHLLKNGKVISVFGDFVDELPEKCTRENLRDFIDSYLLVPSFKDEEDYESKEDFENAQEFNKAIEGPDREKIIDVILDRIYYEYGDLKESKKVEDVAINNGFNVTKYPEVQSLADDIANSIKDKDKIIIDTVISAIENWDNGDTSVFTVLAKVDKNLAEKIEADEDNRYEAENQFLGLVEDTLNDMGITVYDEYDESKKVTEAVENEIKYNGYTFIPVGNVKSNVNINNCIASNKELNQVFNVNNGTYDYNELYKTLPLYDIFKIPELNNILIIPSSNYVFEFTGNSDDYIPADEVQSDEVLRQQDDKGYIGTIEDKEIVDDLYNEEMTYSDIASKYGYSFNNYQLYNIATVYENAEDYIKTLIEDVLEDINYHSECAEIMDNATSFKNSLFESKKVEGVKIDDVKDIENRKYFSILFQLDKLRLFEVNYVLKNIYKGTIGKTSSTFEPTKVVDELTMNTSTFQKSKRDYQSVGYVDEVLANYQKARNFYEKWKKEIFHSLTENEYNELLQDIEVLKNTYNYTEQPIEGPDKYGFRFSQEVELSKMKPKNKVGEAITEDVAINAESKKVESRPDKERAKSNYYNAIKRKLHIPEQGLTSKEEIIDYINKVDDAVGFSVIANSINFPNDRINGNFNRYVSIAAITLDEKYRWDNGEYLDDNDPRLVEPMKKDLIKLVQGFELDKYEDLVNKLEAKTSKTEDIAKNTYNKTNADEINETIKDKEFMNNLGITVEDVIKQVEISKKDFDELVNYVNNYRGTFGELYKELQGWNLGYDDVEKDDDNLFDCYYKSLLVTINVDDGKLSVNPHDVYVYPNDITKVDSDELFHLDFDKPIEFDKILKEDATQCGAVDGGKVSIFGEKEKKEVK